MSTNNSAIKKKGRPAIDSEAVNVRLERSVLDLIDQWRADAIGQPNRPEAMRRLVKLALDNREVNRHL